MFLSVAAHAQQTDGAWEDYFMEAVNIEEYDETQLADIYEYLQELEAQPLNINTATYEQFSKIPGLTLDQISDIMYYRDKYGSLRTMEELSMIRSIERPMRLFLSCLFVAEPVERMPWYKRPALDSLLHRHQGTLLLTGNIPFYERQGNAQQYLGDKYKYNFKLKGHLSDYVKYALAGSKDDGEPVFGKHNPYGFDNYAFFVSLNKLNRINTLVVGRYRMRMGMGLTLSNGFSLGKQYMLTGLSSARTTSIGGYSSRSDSHYLQGVATTLDLSAKGSATKWEASAFWSYRALDATLNDNGTVATLLTSPYHRLQSEMDKKNNTRELMTGGHLAWRRNAWHTGVSGVYTWYDRPLSPSSTQLYRRHYPRGTSFWNASVDYGYFTHRFTLSGETATGDCGDLATLNMLSLLLPKQIRLTAVQRYYSYRYYALLPDAFSDGGHVTNESGLYLGLDMPLFGKLRLSAYTDYAYFPWAKYRINDTSYSWDNRLTLNYSTKSSTWALSYRYQQKDLTSNAFRLGAAGSGSTLRLKTNYTPSAVDWLTTGMQIDYRRKALDTGVSDGIMCSANTTVRMKDGIMWSATAGYFNTDSYDSRVYIYERSLLETFSFTNFYGEGIRLSAVVRADMGRSLMVMAKLGYTDYFDRSTISTADRLIGHSSQTDLSLQVRYKF